MKLFLLVAFGLCAGMALAAPSIPKNREPDEQMSVNLRVYKILDQNGAIQGNEYRFDRTIASSAKANLEALVANVIRNGYLSERIESRPEGTETFFWINVSKIMKYERSTLERESLSMLQLGAQLDVFYDGWGAEIEREKKN